MICPTLPRDHPALAGTPPGEGNFCTREIIRFPPQWEVSQGRQPVGAGFKPALQDASVDRKHKASFLLLRQEFAGI